MSTEHPVSVYIGSSDSILHYLLVSCLISLLQILKKKNCHLVSLFPFSMLLGVSLCRCYFSMLLVPLCTEKLCAEVLNCVIKLIVTLVVAIRCLFIK